MFLHQVRQLQTITSIESPPAHQQQQQPNVHTQQQQQQQQQQSEDAGDGRAYMAVLDTFKQRHQEEKVLLHKLHTLSGEISSIIQGSASSHT
jgi:hypothetical protein